MKVYIVRGFVGDAYDHCDWIDSVHSSEMAAAYCVRDLPAQYSKDEPRMRELQELEHANWISEAERAELKRLENRWYWYDDRAEYTIEEFEVLD